MKKVLVLLFAGFLCFSIAGCGGEDYEDSNGSDNFALQTITDKNIVNLDIGASGLSYTEESLGDEVYSSEYSSKNFNGVERIYYTSYILPSDVQVYIGTMDVKEGNFRLVAVLDDKIIHEFPVDSFNEIFTFENIEGDFSICVAGESAVFEFYLEVL